MVVQNHSIVIAYKVHVTVARSSPASISGEGTKVSVQNLLPYEKKNTPSCISPPFNFLLSFIFSSFSFAPFILQILCPSFFWPYFILPVHSVGRATLPTLWMLTSRTKPGASGAPASTIKVGVRLPVRKGESSGSLFLHFLMKTTQRTCFLSTDDLFLAG